MCCLNLVKVVWGKYRERRSMEETSVGASHPSWPSWQEADMRTTQSTPTTRVRAAHNNQEHQKYSSILQVPSKMQMYCFNFQPIYTNVTS